MIDDSKILNALGDKPQGLTVANLVKITGLSRNTIRKYLILYMEQGLIERVVYNNNTKIYTAK